MPVMAVSKFEQFFRAAAGLDIDKADVKRYEQFLNEQIPALLIRAQATAKSNVRDIIEPFDLPITKGLRQCMYDFEKIDKELGLMPILDQLVARPPLDMAYSVETETQFAPIAGGLSVALARTFTIIDPKVKNPQSDEWERAYRLFTLLL
jgi:hypothetical protein